MRGGSRNTTAGVGAGTAAPAAARTAGSTSVRSSVCPAATERVTRRLAGLGQDRRSRTRCRHSATTTMQSASAVRSLRTTVVQTVSQGESTRVTTEVVANHNHCHALTIQYFEVLRHLSVAHELATYASACSSRCRSHRSTSKGAALAPVARGLPATSRTRARIRRLAPRRDDWSEVDYPVGRYADEQMTSISGELEMTILIPLPPLPTKPLPRPRADTLEQTAKAIKEATEPDRRVPRGRHSHRDRRRLADRERGDKRHGEVPTQAAIEGSRALTEELMRQTSPEAQYEKFQHDVMPGSPPASSTSSSCTHWFAVRGANRSADFTLVSDYRPADPAARVCASDASARDEARRQSNSCASSQQRAPCRLPGDRQQRDAPLPNAPVRACAGRGQARQRRHRPPRGQRLFADPARPSERRPGAAGRVRRSTHRSTRGSSADPRTEDSRLYRRR